MNEISAKLNEISIRKNIPLTATVELTYACPLKCSHCYLQQTQGRVPVYRKRELNTEDWKKILREIKKAGCLYIVFTGGEPLLRQDLARLCQYAAKLKFSIKVFTTGFNLKREFLEKIKDLPVSFELSLYGRKEIHNKITRNEKSFDISLEAAKLLKKSGFQVKLKTPLMKQNAGDAEYVAELAEKFGLKKGFDPLITVSNDGNKKPLKYRLTSKQLRKLLNSKKLELSPEMNGNESANLDFICGAGRNTFAVNPYGDVLPCLQLPVFLGDLKSKRFKDIWKNSKWLKWWRGLTMKDVKVCSKCSLLNWCNRCPGLALLEDGDLMGPSKIACQTAKIIKKSVSSPGS